jgi:hypothetical protein
MPEPPTFGRYAEIPYKLGAHYEHVRWWISGKENFAALDQA